MNTAEMWVKAQNDGKIYECIDGDVAYSKGKGLFDKHTFKPWELGAWDYEGSRGFDELMNCEWEETNSIMTIEQAEERFGIKIIV